MPDNNLMAFYLDKTHELEECGQYFMAAIALAFALETTPNFRTFLENMILHQRASGRADA